MRFAVLVVSTLLVVGCSGGSKRPEVHSYLLRADVQLPQGQQSAPVDIGIGRVTLASYLGQSGIVLLTGENKLRAARQHIWAEPLDSAVRAYLRDAISAEVGYPVSGDTARRLNWDYRLDIGVDQLHGSLDGTVTLVAYWSILNVATQQELGRYRFDRDMQQPEEGYDSLVRTQSALLDQLAGEIAASLSNVGSE